MDIDPVTAPLPFTCLALHMAGYDLESLNEDIPVGAGEDAGFTLVFGADEMNDLEVSYAEGRYTVRVANRQTAGRVALLDFALRANHLLDGRRRFSVAPDGGAVVLTDSVAAAGLELHELAGLLRDMTEAMMLLGEEAQGSVSAPQPAATGAPASYIRG